MKENNKKEKKMNGLLKFVIILTCICLVILIMLKLILPDLFSPKDLGVKWNKESYISMLNKLQYQKIDIPKDMDSNKYNIIYGKANQIDSSFTSEEITSFLNINQPSNRSIKNIQMLINEDNSISLSMSVNVNDLLKEIDAIPNQYKNKDNLPVNFIIPDIANIYGKFSGTIKDNKITNFNVTEFEVMGYDVMIYIKQNYGIQIIKEEIDELLSELNKETGFYITSGTFNKGNFNFNGKFPSSYDVEKK